MSTPKNSRTHSGVPRPVHFSQPPPPVLEVTTIEFAKDELFHAPDAGYERARPAPPALP